MFPGMIFGVWDPSNMILFVIAHRQAPILCPDSAFGVLMPNAANQWFSRHFWSIGKQVYTSHRSQFWLWDEFLPFLTPLQHSLCNCRSRLFFRFFSTFSRQIWEKYHGFPLIRSQKMSQNQVLMAQSRKKKSKKCRLRRRAVKKKGWSCRGECWFHERI